MTNDLKKICELLTEIKARQIRIIGALYTLIAITQKEMPVSDPLPDDMLV